jgi:hypothetical protein
VAELAGEPPNSMLNTASAPFITASQTAAATATADSPL